ncbi:hypothetical protein PCCS19_03730 [Paenibacillus sp. CCS19]|nr:hypothetical protein PCCS19_03730 [Paenibacillus cellulosilyticus]
MRKLFIIVMLMFICCISAACSHKEPTVATIETTVIYHLSKQDGQVYKVFRTIEEPAGVRKVSELLDKVRWENAIVSMSRMPDYKIRTENTDPNVSLVRNNYDFWLSPKGDYFEVVIEGFSKYGKMSPKDSMELLAIVAAK